MYSLYLLSCGNRIALHGQGGKAVLDNLGRMFQHSHTSRLPLCTNTRTHHQLPNCYNTTHNNTN